jgi:hypothetical protein
VLEPYLDDIVIVGGWVPFLYQRYGKIPSRHPVLRTADIDVAVPRSIDERGRSSIDELLSGAGYTTRNYGYEGSIVKYELSSPETEIEFLTPEIGPPGKAALTIQPGLNAQALRYLQILLEHTRKIEINDTIEDSNMSLAVKVPSPEAFIYQKGLTLRLRRSDTLKISKDLYYIFNLLDSSKELQDSIPAEIRSLRSQYVPRWFSTFKRNLDNYFPESGAEGPALVASQYTGDMPIDIFRNYVHRTFRDFIRSLQ